MGVCLTAMRSVTFSTGFLLHGLVDVGASLELVTKKTKIAALPCHLEQVLRCISIAVACGTASDFQRSVQDWETGHVRMTATRCAIFCWRGRTFLRVRLCNRQGFGKNQDEQKNHQGDHKANFNFGTAGSQSTIPIDFKKSLQGRSV